MRDCTKNAIKKWKDKNKDKTYLYTKRSICKGYIRNDASVEELNTLKELIDGVIKEKWQKNGTLQNI